MNLILKLTLEELISTAKAANKAYRLGTPNTSDEYYDTLVARIKELDPDNPWLTEVEPEPELVKGKLVKLPERMLSTDKAYTLKELIAWYDKVVEAFKAVYNQSNDPLNIPKRLIRATPKLDGFAVYNAGDKQITRGNGYEGTDVTHAFKRGLSSPFYLFTGSSAVAGKGEVVVAKKYFAKYLADKYENSRNVIAAVLKESELDEDIKKAVKDLAVCFIPFKELLNLSDKYPLTCEKDITEKYLDSVWQSLEELTYETDGIVFEVNPVYQEVKDYMGSTNHHHRWQIAYKRNTEFHDCKVTSLTWQTSKTGRITPVVNIEPTQISGVTVSKITGHHAGNVISKGIEKGAVVKVCRSGQVIPHIVDVVKAKLTVIVPTVCPSCGSETELDGDNLLCLNSAVCPAQIEGTIQFFFDIIGVKGFGPKTVESLVSMLSKNTIGRPLEVNPIRLVEYFETPLLLSTRIYPAIGKATADNLLAELHRVKDAGIEDWRFLAAFGIPGFGKGACEKLLKLYDLYDVLDLPEETLRSIPGIGEKSAKVFHEYVDRLLFKIVGLKNYFEPSDTKQNKPEGVLSGKKVVFSGTMCSGSSRDDMIRQAISLGASVGAAVTNKTDFLVVGDNAGSKLAAAQKKGVTVYTEDEYLALIK